MIKQRSHHCRQLGRGASHSLLYLGDQNPLLFLCALQTQPQPWPGVPQPAGPPHCCTGRALGTCQLHGNPGQRGPMQQNKTPTSPCKLNPGGVTGQGGSSSILEPGQSRQWDHFPSLAAWLSSLPTAVPPSPASASPAPRPRTPLALRSLCKQCPVTPQPRPSSPTQTGCRGCSAAGHRLRCCCLPSAAGHISPDTTVWPRPGALRAPTAHHSPRDRPECHPFPARSQTPGGSKALASAQGASCKDFSTDANARGGSEPWAHRDHPAGPVAQPQ